MVVGLLVVSLHALLRVHPNQRLLRRVLTPRRGSSMLLLILSLLMHPSISTSKPLPVGAKSARSVKTAGENNGTTGVRANFVGTVTKVNTGRRRLKRGVGTFVGGRCRRAVRADASTWTKKSLRRLLLLLLRRLLLVCRLSLPKGAGSGRYLTVRSEEIVGRRCIANNLIRPQPLTAWR